MLFTTFILDTFILSIISNSVANIINSPSASEQNITTDIFVRDFDQSQVESSSAHVAPPQHRDKVLIEKRFIHSSGSEQDLVKSKEPVQFDDVSQGKESHLFFHKESAISVTTLGSDSHDATAELTTRRRRLTRPEDAPDDGLFGKTRLPIEAREYLRDNSTNHSSILFEGTIFSRGLNRRSHGAVLDWATGAEVSTTCPDPGSRKVSYADLRDAAQSAYKNEYSSWKGWQEIEHIEEEWYLFGINFGSAVARIVAQEGVIALAFRGTQIQELADWIYNVNTAVKSRDGVDVHAGFLTYLEALEPDIKTTRDWLKGTCGIDFDFVTGHSLGGAAASLYGQFNADVGGLDGEGEKGIVTFGAPRTHASSSAAYACELKGARFYHSQDWITGLPWGNWYHALPIEKYENPSTFGFGVYEQDPDEGVGKQCSCDSACHCWSIWGVTTSCACSRSNFVCLQHGLEYSILIGDGYSWWIPEDKMSLPFYGGGGDSCPSTCQGNSCDYWTGNTCAELESDYGCDCGGCTCPNDSDGDGSLTQIDSGTCESEWATGDPGCGTTQSGCPASPCDGDAGGSWCVDVDGKSWFYCANCEVYTKKWKCKKNKACLWKRRECIEKPRCADQTKKWKCKKQAGCQWEKGKCAEQSCASHQKRKECKGQENCRWSRSGKTCRDA